MEVIVTSIRAQNFNETTYMFLKATFPLINEDKVGSFVSLKIWNMEKADRVWWLRDIVPILKAHVQLLL